MATTTSYSHGVCSDDSSSIYVHWYADEKVWHVSINVPKIDFDGDLLLTNTGERENCDLWLSPTAMKEFASVLTDAKFATK